MKSSHVNATRLAAVWLALCCLPGFVLGQPSTVTSDEGRVVIDGDYVRIETPEAVTEVQGDWRTGTHVRVANTEALLVELGAVRTEDTIRLNLAGDVLFEFGSAVVTEAAEEVLRQVADVIRDQVHGEVLAVGHTDAVGDEMTNQRLSEARALEVIRWLQMHEGIPARILVGRGMGERQPLAHETTPDGRDDPAGRARNRRVELFLGTSEHADVRAAAGLVTIQSPAGEVRVDPHGVDVGGAVHIDAGGVRVGGVSVTTDGSVVTTGGAGRTGGSAGGTTCAAGRHCTADCPEGKCRMTCPAGAICDYACLGGDCEMLCSAGATCKLTCLGGDCRFSCATGSNCSTSCPGGDCTKG